MRFAGLVRFAFTGLVSSLAALPAVALEIEVDGNIELETRHFPDEGALPAMERISSPSPVSWSLAFIAATIPVPYHQAFRAL